MIAQTEEKMRKIQFPPPPPGQQHLCRGVMPKASELVIDSLERAAHQVITCGVISGVAGDLVSNLHRFRNARPSVQDWNVVFQGPDVFRDLLVVNFATSG